MSETPPLEPQSLPQPVVGPLTSSAVFLVLTIESGGEAAVRELMADLAGLQRSVGFRVPEAGLSCILGVGSDAWDRLFSGPRPRELHPFRELVGPRHRAVATPGDLLLHIRASQMDVCFELATLVVRRLAAVGPGRRRGSRLQVLRRAGPARLRRRDGEPGRGSGVPGSRHRGRGPRVPRRQLCHRAEVPARPDPVGRAVRGGAGAGDRAHQARQHRAAGRRQAGQLARGPHGDHRTGRHRATDPARQHAVRLGRRRASSVRTSSAMREPPR